MRKMLFLVVTGLAAFAAKAQNNGTPGAIRISGTRLTYPLVEKWIKEFGKTHPGITIALASGLPQDSADIAIVSHILTKGDVKEGKTSIVLNRYVQLPVVNSRRKDVLQLQEKGFTDAAFRQVYFADTAKGSELARLLTCQYQPTTLPFTNAQSQPVPLSLLPTILAVSRKILRAQG